MSNIFPSGGTMFVVNDNSVPLLLLIKVASEASGDGVNTQKGASNPFDEIDIMNFSTKTNCDFQIQRSASGGFVYNVFGNNICQITLEGIQAPPSARKSTTGGIEAYYNKSNISGKSRALISITAAYYTTQDTKQKDGTFVKTTDLKSVHAETVTYQGYMVGFRKKPMGQDKIPGYGFTLDLVCRVMPKEAKSGK